MNAPQHAEPAYFWRIKVSVAIQYASGREGEVTNFEVHLLAIVQIVLCFLPSLKWPRMEALLIFGQMLLLKKQMPAIEKLYNTVDKKHKVFVILLLDEDFEMAKSFAKADTLNLSVYYPVKIFLPCSARKAFRLLSF